MCLRAVTVFAAIMAAAEEVPYLRDAYPIWDAVETKGDCGKILMLTPLIESGDTDAARKLALVQGDPFSAANLTSYSGYFTVNKLFESNLFFWFFPAQVNYETAPILLWLQGGPGTSSLYGLFNEIGPYFIGDDNVTLFDNVNSWHKNYSILFIDNPVGTGFSFTKSDDGYATNQTQVGSELYEAMTQFFAVFQELRSNDFYIVGESYAGKYIPALGYTIHKNNPTAPFKINLKGLIVGNGFTDPINYLQYSDFLYQVGLIDSRSRSKLATLEASARKALNSGDSTSAFFEWSAILKLIQEETHYHNLYHFLQVYELPVGFRFSSFVQLHHVRKAIHVGDTPFTSTGLIYQKLIPDIMTSMRPWVEELLDNGYRVVYYNGQLDIIVAYPLVINMCDALQFNAAEEYKMADRMPWYVDGELAGYVKTGGNFSEVLVRNAGHMVPADQPEWTLDLINRITNDQL